MRQASFDHADKPLSASDPRRNEMEEKTNETANQGGGEQTPLTQALNGLKNDMVSKEEYDKVLKENQEYAKTVKDLFTGEGSGQSQKQEETVDCSKLKRELSSGNLNNLDYVKTALKLREEVIKQGKEDPFVPQGINIHATAEDSLAAERVADALQYCVDNCEGDSGVFTAMLQSITNDTKIPKKQ